MKTITAYHHPAPTTEQAPDPSPGNYYCSVRDGERLGLLIGPLPSHQAALTALPLVKSKAQQVDAFAAFYSFGTVKMKDDFTRPGTLNRFFPELFS